MNSRSLTSEIAAEFLGTFVLVFVGCGSAIFAASVVGDDNIAMGTGFLGLALGAALAGRRGALGDRSEPDAHPPHLDPGVEHRGQPRPLPGSGDLPRR
ncbi:aquaporin [Bacillus subtilis]|nr:aquaporin [Bacillus subtilis]